MSDISITRVLAQRTAQMDAKGGFFNRVGSRFINLGTGVTSPIDAATYLVMATLKVPFAPIGTLSNIIMKRKTVIPTINDVLADIIQAIKFIALTIFAPLVGIVSPTFMYNKFFPQKTRQALNPKQPVNPPVDKAKALAEKDAAKEAKDKAHAQVEDAKKAEDKARALIESAKEAEGNASSLLEAAKEAENNASAQVEAAKEAEDKARAQVEAAKKTESMTPTLVEAAQAAQDKARAQVEAAQAAEDKARAQTAAAQKAEGKAHAQIEAAKEAKLEACAQTKAAQVAEDNACAQIEAAKEAEGIALAQIEALQEAENKARAKYEAALEAEDKALNHYEAANRHNLQQPHPTQLRSNDMQTLQKMRYECEDSISKSMSGMVEGGSLDALFFISSILAFDSKPVAEPFPKEQLEIQSTFTAFFRDKHSEELTLKQIIKSLSAIGQLPENHRLYYGPDGAIDVDQSYTCTRAVRGLVSTMGSDKAYDIGNLAFFVDFLNKYVNEEPIPYTEALQIYKQISIAIEENKGLNNLFATYDMLANECNQGIVKTAIFELNKTRDELKTKIDNFNKASLTELSAAVFYHLSTFPRMSDKLKLNEARRLVASWGKINPSGRARARRATSFLEILCNSLNALPLEATHKQLLLAEAIMIENKFIEAEEKAKAEDKARAKAKSEGKAELLEPSLLEEIKKQRVNRIAETNNLLDELITISRQVSLAEPKKIKAMEIAIKKSELFEEALDFIENPLIEAEKPIPASSLADYVPAMGYCILGFTIEGISTLLPNPILKILCHKAADRAYEYANLNVENVNSEIENAVNGIGNREKMGQNLISGVAGLLAPAEAEEEIT